MFGVRRAASGPSKASSLLQKVSTQLSGGKIAAGPHKPNNDDDDGLGVQYTNKFLNDSCYILQYYLVVLSKSIMF